MFDGIRLTFTDEAFVKNLEANQPPNTKRTINTYGELNNYIVDFKSLKITAHPNGYVIIRGSLHKYFNDGKHNHNSFTIDHLKEVITTLKTELGLKPDIALVSNLEFGVNITTPFDPNDLLNDLIRHKDRGFNLMKMQGAGNGRSCSYKQYEIKIYNKGLQYGISSNLLRIEKKVLRMCSLKYGKLYLNNLLDVNLWRHCEKELLNSISCITINETVNENLLSGHQADVYDTLPNNAKWSAYSRNKRCRYRKVYNEIISSFGLVNYREQIINLVTAKCNELAKRNGTILPYK